MSAERLSVGFVGLGQEAKPDDNPLNVFARVFGGKPGAPAMPGTPSMPGVPDTAGTVRGSGPLETTTR